MKIKHISTKFILASIGILAAVVIVLVTAFYITAKLTMDDYIRENTFSMQNELDSSVAEVVDETAYLYGRMMRSENSNLLNTVADETLVRTDRQEAFNSLIERVGINKDYFLDVVAVIDDMRFSVNNLAPLGNDSFEILDNNRNAIRFVGTEAHSVVTGIYTTGGWVSQYEGYFLFYIAESKINEMCNPVSGEEGYSFIMRSDGYIISHIDESLVGKVIVYSDVYNPAATADYKTEVLDGVRSIVVASRPSQLNSRYGFDCSIVSVLDYGFYFGNLDLLLSVSIGIAFAALCVAVAIAIIQAHKISRPLIRLSRSINATAEPTNVHTSVLEDGDELKQLERNYDEMMDRIFDLVEKNKEDMQLQRKLELESLQMQINPHFLYNTLDAISWMARIKNQPEIDRLVMNLAKFFRLFLHGGDKFVTVADEVEMVVSYLEIDKIRFPGRVTVHTEVEEEIKQCMVLKLMLQPAVENCLKYAFTGRHGNIYIRAYSKAEDIIFEVEDDGAGFNVPADILTRPPKKEGGYGLKNVHERIRLQYGEGYGIDITSEIGKGTMVRLKLKK